MKKLLIKGGTVVTMNNNREIIKADVLVQGSVIKKVGRIGAKEAEGARLIDASGQVVAPGFVQTHVHLCQTLFRNLADDLELLDWLKLKIWPFEAAHTPSTIAISARMGLSELIQCGTTTIMDMATVHHTDHVFEEIDRSGIRAFCGKAMMDECPGAPEGLAESRGWSMSESLHLHKTWHNRSNGRIRFAFAPRFVLSCSEALLMDVKLAAAESGLIVHTHSSENKGELDAVIRKCGVPNVEYFHKIGLTGERLCLAHCIWLNGREVDILRDTRTRVLHCPSSNLKLGSGIAGIPEMLARGIHVSLGADGAPCNNNLDIFQEMRLAALIQKPRLGPKSLTAEQVYAMATRGGAEALGILSEVGSLEAGKKADIVIMNLSEIHSSPSENIYSQIVYSARSSDVQTVLCDGKVLMKDRVVKTVDREETRRAISQSIKTILRRV